MKEEKKKKGGGKREEKERKRKNMNKNLDSFVESFRRANFQDLFSLSL